VRRLRFASLGAVVGLLALSPAGSAAPERNEVIRMGNGIGKVRLGMTLPQVRRAFGPHRVVYRRLDFGARGRYIELGWELPGRVAWEPVVWNVGFRSTSRRGPLRVTRIGTDARSQRTPQGLGVGSRLRALVSAYPDAECVSRWGSAHPGAWVVVDGPRGMTAFQVDDKSQGARPTTFFVIGVMVQRAWFSKAPYHERCLSGWEDW
jgi:hypothetical protein